MVWLYPKPKYKKDERKKEEKIRYKMHCLCSTEWWSDPNQREMKCPNCNANWKNVLFHPN